MQSIQMQVNKYYDLLHTIIEDMQKVIDKKIDLIDIDNGDINQVDEYIKTLNSFYYQSFHQRFFPEYRRILNYDISNLFNIKADETEIKNNIIKLFKEAARCYNHLKEALVHLAQINNLAQSELIHLKQRTSLTRRKFFNLLQSAQEQLDKLQNLIADWEKLHKSDPLSNSFSQHPGHISLIYVIPALDLNNKNHTRVLNNLMVNLQVYTELLENYRHSIEVNRSSYWHRVLAFRNENLETAAKKMPPELKNWYNKYLLRYIDSCQDIISANSESKKVKIVNKTAGEFADWINSLVKILQTILKPYLDNKFYLDLLLKPFWQPEKELTKLNDFCKTVDLSKFIKDIDPQADLNIDDYIIQQLNDILEPAQDFLQEYLRDKKLLPKSSLLKEVYELQYRFNTIELFQEEIEQNNIPYNAVMIHWENFLTIVNKFNETLTSLKIDLEKFLAPRNAVRQFKNVNVHIEHYILERDQPFPSNYNYLLEQEITDNQEAIVLSAKGDLFVIRIDDLLEIELPQVKTALKES